MVEELRYRSDEHDNPLCHPYTQLVTFEPSRRRLPPLRRRPIMGSMFTAARRRRGTHTALGILVGLIVGFLFASRFAVTVLWGGVINSGNWTPCTSFSGVAPGVAPVPLANLQVVSGKQQVSDPHEGDEENVHNSKKSLLFVGVMTAQKYLATRAKAVYETWGSEIPGRIAFFSSAVSQPPTSRPDLPLVRLKGVDDSYPPQKKSFLMLQYMWEKYGDRFEWFLRADDDVYVRADKLERLLRAVDSRKPQFIGQAGRGNQEEFGLLSLEYDENFCMGGPGVLLSRETLARVAPHVKACLRNLYTTHEDVELGRCVQRFAGIPCTWSYEMQTILYHNSSGNDAFTGNLKQKEVHRAITLHPVKNYQHMYRMHNYMKSLKIQELQQQSLKLHRDIAKMVQLLGDKPENAEHIMLGSTPLFPAKKGSPSYLGDSGMLGMEPGLNKFRSRSESEVLSWDFISRSLYSSNNANPRRRIESPLREGLDDIIREVMDMINMYSKQRGRVIEYREILYGYHRVNPIFGADYILDLLLVYKKYRGHKMTVPVRRHVYVQQQFTGLEIRETLDGQEIVPPSHSEDEEGMTQEDQSGPQNQLASFRDVLESGLLRIGEVFPGVLGAPDTKEFDDNVRNKIINFILPLACRYDAFRRFLSVYEDLCLQDDQKTTLTVVVYHCEKETQSYNQSLGLLELLHQKYPLAKIHTIYSRGYFARASALQLGADHFSDSGSLLLFIDVDIIFTSRSLERIRTNTIQGKQVYFPIVFSEFDPNFVYDGVTVPPDHFAVESTRGYWRQYGYGIVSVYKSDLQKIGGFDTGIRGWGKEDVDLFDKFVSVAANLSVFRAADPHLVHVFHVVECDPLLDKLQLSMCKGSRADTYGSIPQLAQYIYEHKDEIFIFAKYRKEKEPAS